MFITHDDLMSINSENDDLRLFCSNEDSFNCQELIQYFRFLFSKIEDCDLNQLEINFGNQLDVGTPIYVRYGKNNINVLFFLIKMIIMDEQFSIKNIKELSEAECNSLGCPLYQNYTFVYDGDIY